MSVRAESSRSMSIADYFALEANSEHKHEYVGGEVYLLAGATEPHSLIVTNVLVETALAARGTHCRVLGSDMRLGVSRDVYYYADLMVACDPSDNDPLVKTRPCLLVEVSSESTEAIDRREKLLAYRGVASLQMYLIISQTARFVIAHQRLPDGSWWREEHHGDGTLELPCPSSSTLTLEAMYAGVIARTRPAPDQQQS